MPLFSDMLTTEPLALPNSAAALPVAMLISAMASTLGLNAMPLSMVSLMSTPSSRKLLLCSRFPFVYGLPLVPEGVTEPGISRTSVVKLRPGSGSELALSPLITPPGLRRLSL